MRVITYKTHWSYFRAGVKRKERLSEFILDTIYIFEKNGIIPPLHILNMELQKGGNNGGMSPGTTWKPFTITEAEYNELVETLLALDIEEAKKTHPYIHFDSFKVDETLHEHQTRLDWRAAVAMKYDDFDLMSYLKNLEIDPQTLQEL